VKDTVLSLYTKDFCHMSERFIEKPVGGSQLLPEPVSTRVPSSFLAEFG